MSAVLEVALFFASLAIITLVLCIIPIAFLALRRLEHLVVEAEQVKVNVQTLLQDSSELVHNINELTKQISRQASDVTYVLDAVHDWTARADAIVNEVADAIEPPVSSFSKTVTMLRIGTAAFMHTLFRKRSVQNKE